MPIQYKGVKGGGIVILYQGHLLLLRRVWQFLQLLKLSHQDQGGVQGRVAHPLVHGDDLNFGQVDVGLGKGWGAV